MVKRKPPTDSLETLRKLRASAELQEDDKKQILSELSQKREGKRIIE